ncbi:MAG: hypothetical protein FADNKDHG_00551 [Holosporales bacterium]
MLFFEISQQDKIQTEQQLQKTCNSPGTILKLKSIM